jgi:hypothetical protein
MMTMVMIDDNGDGACWAEMILTLLLIFRT